MPSRTLGSETQQSLSAITQGDCPPEVLLVGSDKADKVKLYCGVGMDFLLLLLLHGR